MGSMTGKAKIDAFPRKCRLQKPKAL